MGSQCGRLCCRPCRKQMTLKERIDHIFLLAPMEITEAYCRNKGNKLCEFLKDRHSQIPSCISEFKLLINNESESERTCIIILLTLKSMTEVLKDFLNLTYLCILKIMKKPFFNSLKTEVYETLTAVTNLYPDEEGHSLEDILNEILRYLSEPKNISKQEIRLLTSLLTPIHAKISENVAFDWKKMTGLILDRVVEQAEPEEELKLLHTFCKELFENGVIRDEFFRILISFLHSKKAWNKGVSIFKAIGTSVGEQASLLVKLFMEYLQNHPSVDCLGVGECLFVTLDLCDSIETIYFSELFKKNVVKIVMCDNELGKKVLTMWGQKTDFLSYFKIFREILLAGKAKKGYEIIVYGCKKRIKVEMDKRRKSNHFIQNMIELVYDCITNLKYQYSDFIFKNMGFLIEKISENLTFRKNEISSVFTCVLKILKLEDIKTDAYKTSLSIVLSVISQRSHSHVPLIFSMIAKIRSLLNPKNNEFIGLMLLVLLKASGKAYEIESLVQYTNQCAGKYINVEKVKILLEEDTEFSKVFSKEESIFVKDIKKLSKFPSEVFQFEDQLKSNSVFEDFNEEENDEEFLGFNQSENEFSSASSFEIQDRIIDSHDVRVSIAENDYSKLLVAQECQDNFLFGNLNTKANINNS